MIGGLSAHADQADLVDWYRSFEDRTPVYLVHGEDLGQKSLLEKLKSELGAPAHIARYQQKIGI